MMIMESFKEQRVGKQGSHWTNHEGNARNIWRERKEEREIDFGILEERMRGERGRKQKSRR